MRHLVAILAGLLVAFAVSRTGLTQTGVQFIGPLAAILGVHALWCNQTAAAASVIWRDSALSGGLLAIGTLAAATLAPLPAQADVGETISGILTVLFCVAIIAVVIVVLSAIGWVLGKGVEAATSPFRRDKDDPDSRLFEFGGLAVIGVFLTAASLEGLVFGFDPVHDVTVSRTISSSETQVWDTMQTATSPTKALPLVLQNFPQPTDVSVDEGTNLGANRVVTFAGREGRGELHLRVTEAAAGHALFTVQSDTSPFAMWIGFQALSYATQTTADGTNLTVSLRFERRLAPAVVFDPMMKAAARRAAAVLADDVKARAEG